MAGLMGGWWMMWMDEWMDEYKNDNVDSTSNDCPKKSVPKTSMRVFS